MPSMLSKTTIIFFIFLCISCKKNEVKSQKEQTRTFINLTYKQYNSLNKIWEITTKFAKHYPKNNEIFAKSIKGLFFEDKKNTSRFFSDTGILKLNLKSFVLSGNVRIFSNKNKTKIFTEKIFYDPQKDRLISNTFVKLIREDSITYGQHLEATTDLESITIKKQTVEILNFPE